MANVERYCAKGVFDPAAYSQAISVADLRALLEHLKIRRAAVGGLSMGGNIALNFALAHPDIVTALIVADTGAGSDDAADWVATVHGLADALEQLKTRLGDYNFYQRHNVRI